MRKKRAPALRGQLRAPLFEALARYLGQDKAAFHTPGHKQGAGIDPAWLDLVGRGISGWT